MLKIGSDCNNWNTWNLIDSIENQKTKIYKKKIAIKHFLKYFYVIRS